MKNWSGLGIVARLKSLVTQKRTSWTTEHLRKFEYVGAARYLSSIDVRVNTESAVYTLRHLHGEEGWEVKIDGMPDNTYSNVQKAVIQLMGGIEKVIVEGDVIRPYRDIPFRAVARYIEQYPYMGLNHVAISDVAVSSDIPKTLYAKARAAGIPLNKSKISSYKPSHNIKKYDY